MLKADKTCNKNISLCHDISCYHSQVLKKPLQNLHNLHVLYDKTILAHVKKTLIEKTPS